MIESQRAIELLTAISTNDFKAIYDSGYIDRDLVNEYTGINQYEHDSDVIYCLEQEIERIMHHNTSEVMTAYELDKKYNLLETEDGLANQYTMHDLFVEFEMYSDETVDASVVISSSGSYYYFVKDKNNELKEIHNTDYFLDFNCFCQRAAQLGVSEEVEAYAIKRSPEEKSYYCNLVAGSDEPEAVISSKIEKSEFKSVLHIYDLAPLILEGNSEDIFYMLVEQTETLDELIEQYGITNTLILDLGNYEDVILAMGDLKIENSCISPETLIEHAEKNNLPILRNNTDNDWLIQGEDNIFEVNAYKDNSRRWMGREVITTPESETLNYGGLTFSGDEKHLKNVEMSLYGIKDMETINIDDRPEVKKTRTIKPGR